jgi:hypothetical protein
MGTSSRLATVLDAEMLRQKGVNIFAPGTSLVQMQTSPHQPVNISSHLGERYLLRYLLPHQVGTLLNGTPRRQYVTPTPYAPEETGSWLALPSPNQPRPYVLLLDPTQLRDVYGPRWVQMGGGIEYILAQGFRPGAIVNMSPDPSTTPPRWELEVK